MFSSYSVSVINCASPESIQPANVSGTLPNTSNFENNQHRQKKPRRSKQTNLSQYLFSFLTVVVFLFMLGMLKERSTKKKPEHKNCTTTTNKTIKNQVLPEQINASLQFQLLVQQFEQNISRLKTALCGLSQQSQQQVYLSNEILLSSIVVRCKALISVP